MDSDAVSTQNRSVVRLFETHDCSERIKDTSLFFNPHFTGILFDYQMLWTLSHNFFSTHTPYFYWSLFFYLSHVNLCASKHLLHVALNMSLSATWLLQLLVFQSLYIMHEFIMQHDSAGLYILLFRPVPACPDSACKHEKDDCSLFCIRSVVKHEFQAGRTHFISWGENAVLTFLFVCSLNFFWTSSSTAHHFKNSKEII